MGEDIRPVLEARSGKYGDFRTQGQYAQEMKNVVRSAPSWKFMTGYQQEAIDMILHKVSRIVNGDPDYDDSWIDIIGYAQLVLDRMKVDKAQPLRPDFTENDTTPISNGTPAFNKVWADGAGEQMARAPHARCDFYLIGWNGGKHRCVLPIHDGKHSLIIVADHPAAQRSAGTATPAWRKE